MPATGGKGYVLRAAEVFAAASPSLSRDSERRSTRVTAAPQHAPFARLMRSSFLR